ncbi:MAG: MGMT family protein [Deltaproteobacteria bacterium]|nr:MGMT family protein [Deltaproteobacteria bacterium]
MARDKRHLIPDQTRRDSRLAGRAFPGKKAKAPAGKFFQQRVLEIIRSIPPGSVLTYGQVAALADTPRAARQVGRILYFYGESVPWQRVINHYGGLSTYKVGSGERQRVLLEEEGLSFRADGTIDLKRYQWRPSLKIIKKLGLPEEIAFQINLKLT